MILNSAYREAPGISNSMLKDFITLGPSLYFQKHVDPTKTERIEFSTKSTDIGDLLDCLVTAEKHVFDATYYIMPDVSLSADFREIVNKTFNDIYSFLKHRKNLTNEEMLKHPYLNDTTNPNVKSIFAQNCREHVKADGSIGWNSNYKDETLGDKLTKDGSEYYKSLLIANGRKVIDNRLYDTAVRMKEDLAKNKVISKLLFEKPEKNFERVFQAAVSVEYRSENRLKSLMDFLLINHKAKVIWPFDIKTAFSRSQFLTNYRKFYYDQQGDFYTYVLQCLYPDYTIEPFKFITAFTESKELPMIYVMDKTDGVVIRNGSDKQKGWLSHLDELLWHYNTNNWDYPKEFYEKGFIMLSMNRANNNDLLSTQTDTNIF